MKRTSLIDRFRLTAVSIALIIGLLAGCTAERAPPLALPAPVTVQPPTAPVPIGYTIIQSLEIKASDGVAPGTLQLLEDDRLTPELRQELWGKVIDPVRYLASAKLSAEKNPDVAQVTPKTMRTAQLRFVDPQGWVTILLPLNTRLAGIEAVQLYGTDKPTYLVTEGDHGMRKSDAAAPDSSAVLVTNALEIIGNRFEPLTVWQTKDVSSGIMTLFATKHAAWRLVDARETDGKEIEALSCDLVKSRGDDGRMHPQFELTYTTYRFDGKNWMEKTEKHPGCWEDDQDFPAQGNFP